MRIINSHELTYYYQFRRVSRLLACILATGVVGIAHSNPVLNNVAEGNVVVQQQSDTQIEVQQTSQQAIINWNSFNIGANEHTNFQQPVGGVALNRIDPTQGASNILGYLSATGTIILVNGAGIYFGTGSHVNVGSVIASTTNISDANFMANKYIFDQPSSLAGGVTNQGTINANDYGLVALLGTGIINQGVIQATLGNIVLASGNQFTLDFNGDQLINFSIDAAAVASSTGSQQLGISNTGELLANGGKILISANAAQSVLDTIINLQGVAQANSVTSHNGVIILSGGDTGTVQVDGTLQASGAGEGLTGGTIQVLGQGIHLTANANLDVSGDIGGGEISLGGNPHSAEPEQTALSATLDIGSVLNASALTTGNGGTVGVWSNNSTQFYGNISAQGGAQSGNGGLVEISGGYLDITGSTVNTLAPAGNIGTWLLDPTNIYIALDEANAVAAGMPDTDERTSSDSLFTTDCLATALDYANVFITTNAYGTGEGNITVVDPLSWSSARTLTLTATGNIAINGAITTGAAGSALILNAIGEVTQTAPIGGSGGLVQQGIGTTTLSQANTYTGTTTVNNGVLSISADSNLGTAPASFTVAQLVLNGGTLQTTAPLILGGPNNTRGVTVGENGGTILNSSSALTIGSAINGSNVGVGNLMLSGSGTINLNGTVGSMYSLANLTSNVANLAINTSAITTVDSQAYFSPISLGSSTLLTTTGDYAEILLAYGVAGEGQNLTLAGGTGSNDFILFGDLAVNTINVVGGEAGENALIVQTNNPIQTWVVSNNINNGSIKGINEMTGSFNFTNIQGLAGGNNYLEQSVRNLISSNNTLDLSAYSPAVNVIMAANDDGYMQAGATFLAYLGMDGIVGNGNSTLTVAIPNQTNVIYIAGPGEGDVNGAINFSKFNSFASVYNNTDVVFNTPAIYDLMNNTAYVDNMPLGFLNINSFSGDDTLMLSSGSTNVIVSAINAITNMVTTTVYATTLSSDDSSSGSDEISTISGSSAEASLQLTKQLSYSVQDNVQTINDDQNKLDLQMMQDLKVSNSC